MFLPLEAAAAAAPFSPAYYYTSWVRCRDTAFVHMSGHMRGRKVQNHSKNWQTNQGHWIAR